MSVLVVGGYGTFGGHAARALAARGVAVTVAGRDLARARAFAATVGDRAAACAFDAAAPDGETLSRHRVVLSCAGPFDAPSPLPEAALAAGASWVDIAESREHARRMRALGVRFAARGLACVYGCSSLPGLSGALALLARDGAGGAPLRRARLTLFIGNDNAKGDASVRSAVAQIGRPIDAPGGPLTGFRDPERVELPPPFGRRAVRSFDSPDYDLLPEILSVPSLAVKVGFEVWSANLAFATLARLGPRFGDRTSRALDRLASLVRGRGVSGGAVVADLFALDGAMHRAAIHGPRDAQRMAALPAAIVAAHLDAQGATAVGALTAWQLLGARPLLDAVAHEGFTLESPPPAVTAREDGAS